MKLLRCKSRLESGVKKTTSHSLVNNFGEQLWWFFSSKYQSTIESNQTEFKARSDHSRIETEQNIVFNMCIKQIQ